MLGLLEEPGFIRDMRTWLRGYYRDRDARAAVGEARAEQGARAAEAAPDEPPPLVARLAGLQLQEGAAGAERGARAAEAAPDGPPPLVARRVVAVRRPAVARAWNALPQGENVARFRAQTAAIEAQTAALRAETARIRAGAVAGVTSPQGGRRGVKRKRPSGGCRGCGDYKCGGCYCGSLRGTGCGPITDPETGEQELGQHGQSHVPSMARSGSPASLTKALNALGVSAEGKAQEGHKHAEDGVMGPSQIGRTRQKQKYRGGEARARGRRLASSTKDAILRAANRHMAGETRGTRSTRLSPWETICLISEFAALMAGVLAVGYHGRRLRGRAAARDGRSRTRRVEEHRTMYATDSAGQRKWQKHIEAQARKKGIAIALLLGWIRTPFDNEEEVAGHDVNDAAMYIGKARRNSSLGIVNTSSQRRVRDAQRELSAATAEDAEEAAKELQAVEEARAAFMESLESKADADMGEGLDEEAARLAAEAAVQAIEAARTSAKEALDAAMRNFTRNPAERAVGIEKCRSELRLAEEAGRTAPEGADELEARAESGNVEGLQVKNVMAQMRLATERNMSKGTWQELWPTLTRKLQKQLWNRGKAQLYEIIVDSLDDIQMTLITAANSDDQLDGLLAYRILRSHCYGSQEEWTAKLWNTVQSWSQDRGARHELGAPRKLLDAIMELEADIADYEATGEKVTERNKLMILKKGLAKRQRPALEKIKDDLSGEHWDYKKTVDWLLTWSRLHQEEVKKGEAELISTWRGKYGGRTKATANVVRPASGPGGATHKKKGNCFICGSPDHWAAECPKRDSQGASARLAGARPRGPRANGDRDSFRCGNCGAQGHYARDCKKPKQKRKCFICGSDKHMQADCPQKNGGKQSGRGGGYKKRTRPAAAKKATGSGPPSIKLSRDKLKSVVKYANSNRNASTITLSIGANGKLSAAASGSKPAPTTLMLIPMPIGAGEDTVLANMMSGNKWTREVIDSGASKSTVPLQFELVDEREANIDVQGAGDGMRARCTREGQDGALGGSMKMETSTPLVATGPLDEKGVTILFSDNKAIACTTKFIRDTIKDAIRLNHAKVVGERRPDWVYEMTDRRSLERVVRAAERDDIEIDTAESEQIVGRLPEEADYPFEAYDFDPNVYADESREERSRQWRNEKARRNADADKGRIEEVREILHDEEVVNFDDDETTQCPTCEGEGWTKTFGCGLCGLTTATPDGDSAEESSGSTESEIPSTPEEKPAAMAASTLHQPDTPRKIGEFPIVGDTLSVSSPPAGLIACSQRPTPASAAPDAALSAVLGATSVPPSVFPYD